MFIENALIIGADWLSQHTVSDDKAHMESNIQVCRLGHENSTLYWASMLHMLVYFR